MTSSMVLFTGETHSYGEGAETAPVNKRFVCDLCPEGFVYMRYVYPRFVYMSVYMKLVYKFIYVPFLAFYTYLNNLSF